MAGLVAHVNLAYNLTDPAVAAGDPRVADWFLMSSPIPMLVLTATYLMAVTYWPGMMQDKELMPVNKTLVMYNFIMVALSLYMFKEFVACMWHNSFGFLCQPPDYSKTEIGYREANVAWWYFFSKIIEFLDTMFFIVRKKTDHVTFLHVFHHATMAPICWYVAKYVPGGEKFYAGGFNVLVHVMMYTYYGLSACGVKVWWKRYVTKFQMLQFVAVNVRCVLSLLFRPDCAYPRWINAFAACYSAFLLALFANFYRRAYNQKSPGQKNPVTAQGQKNPVTTTARKNPVSARGQKNPVSAPEQKNPIPAKERGDGDSAILNGKTTSIDNVSKGTSDENDVRRRNLANGKKSED